MIELFIGVGLLFSHAAIYLLGIKTGAAYARDEALKLHNEYLPEITDVERQRH